MNLAGCVPNQGRKAALRARVCPLSDGRRKLEEVEKAARDVNDGDEAETRRIQEERGLHSSNASDVSQYCFAWRPV